MSPGKNYTDDVQAIEKITRIFKAERIVYLCVTIVSLVMLLSSAVVMLYKGQGNAAELSLMFGSSGLITYSTTRLLHMWDQAMQILKSNKGQES